MIYQIIVPAVYLIICLILSTILVGIVYLVFEIMSLWWPSLKTKDFLSSARWNRGIACVTAGILFYLFLLPVEKRSFTSPDGERTLTIQGYNNFFYWHKIVLKAFLVDNSNGKVVGKKRVAVWNNFGEWGFWEGVSVEWEKENHSVLFIVHDADFAFRLPSGKEFCPIPPALLGIKRAEVFDFEGRPLTVNQSCHEIFADPQMIKDPKTEIRLADLAAEHLGIDQALALERIKRKYVQKYRGDTLTDIPCRYALLAKYASNEQTLNFKKALDDNKLIQGIHLRENTKRYYPNGILLANVLGLVTPDGNRVLGMFGIEAWIDKQEENNKRTGRIYLTIRQPIQEILEQELTRLYENREAYSVFAIIAEPKTGNILAIAQRPSFNPNERKSMNPNTRNYSLDRPFKPGDAIAPFAVAETMVGHTDKYEEAINLYDSLYMLGFGQSTGILLSPEATGFLRKPNKSKAFTSSPFSYGYRVKVTALQLARAYCAVADNGNLRSMRIIDRIKHYDNGIMEDFPILHPTKAFENPEICQRIIGSFPKKTNLNGTEIAVKNMIIPQYSEYSEVNFAGGIGFAPAVNPEFVLVLIMDFGYEPKGEMPTATAMDNILARIAGLTNP